MGKGVTGVAKFELSKEKYRSSDNSAVKYLI